MLHRQLFHRAWAQATRLASVIHLHRAPRQPSGESAIGQKCPDLSPADVTPAPHLSPLGTIAQPLPAASPPTTGTEAATSPPPTGTEPTPAERTIDVVESHHQRGLDMARSHRWNWAQRELEAALRHTPSETVRVDLETVRAARRHLRLLQKRPRDARTHLLLGKCYFELDMGEDAEREFQRALELAPHEPEAYYFLALEYCYRGDVQKAEHYYRQAQTLVEGLPPFADLLAECRQLTAGAESATPDPASSSDRAQSAS